MVPCGGNQRHAPLRERGLGILVKAVGAVGSLLGEGGGGGILEKRIGG